MENPFTVFTVEEAAKELGVSPQRVRALLSDAKMNGIKRGGAWFVNVSEVREYAQKARKAGRPPRTWESLAEEMGFDKLPLSPEEEAKLAEMEAEAKVFAEIRADYAWIKECEKMPIYDLRKRAYSQDAGPKRRYQALAVLECREK